MKLSEQEVNLLVLRMVDRNMVLHLKIARIPRHEYDAAIEKAGDALAVEIELCKYNASEIDITHEWVTFEYLPELEPLDEFEPLSDEEEEDIELEKKRIPIEEELENWDSLNLEEKISMSISLYNQDGLLMMPRSTYKSMCKQFSERNVFFEFKERGFIKYNQDKHYVVLGNFFSDEEIQGIEKYMFNRIEHMRVEIRKFVRRYLKLKNFLSYFELLI